MDDGASDIDEALQLCAMGRHNHIKETVATPHFNADYDLEEFLQQRDRRLSTLKRAALENEIDMPLYAGAEVFIDDKIFYSANLGKLTINNSRYILIEFSFAGLKMRDVMGYLREIYSMGLVPIIAHPERYRFFQKNYDMLNDLASRGIRFQLNADSLASRNGREEFELAYEMAFKGVASFIATDAHSPYDRANDFSDMIRAFPTDINKDHMQRMLVSNAKRVLRDEDLPPIVFRHLEKRRFY